MNLRNTRLDRRLTQPQVVAKMKEVEPRVDVALYSKMESGICLPTPAQMGVILSVLDCHLHDLYTLDEIAFSSIQPEVIEIPEETRIPVRPASLTAARETATARPGGSACAWTTPRPPPCRRSATTSATRTSKHGSKIASTP